VISTATHMSYADFADPEVIAHARANGFARGEGAVSTWDVVCSGFFDSVGMYKELGVAQRRLAVEWIGRFGLEDLVVPPPARQAPPISSRLAAHSPGYAAAARRAADVLRAKDGSAGRNFFHLSFGQQKLVLLCRAVVKSPRLLLLDEPTHGLSSVNRQRLLGMLSTLAGDVTIALVLVTHRQDEIDQLGFEKVLRLDS
jgi:molybdate transport system ATP-binding protein